jgi:glyoxylase-like metal-dependent hydrolase (beta-lactamase superfamily II)
MRHERHTIDADPAQPGFAAAYLRVAGDACMFVEAYTTHALPHLLAALDAHGLRPGDVRYVLVTHAHLDHAGGAGALLAACPGATLLAHPRAARHLVDPSRLVKSATAVYGEERFRALYGRIDPIPEGRVRALDDGEAFPLGDATLRVHHTAGHAKHHLVVDDPATDTVFTGDTFGLVYPRLQRAGRFAFPSTSPTDFDPAAARASVARVLALGRSTVCPTHFGEATGPAAIAAQLGRWLDRAEQWLDEAAASGVPLDAAERDLAARWWAALEEAAREVGLALDEGDRALLEVDVDLNAQGIAFAAGRRREAASGAAR